MIYGINATRKSGLNLEQFQKCLNKLNYDFYDYEQQNLFKILDKK